MSYVKTEWREHSMSQAEKLAALDNLEGMYNEIVSYINAITHSSSYYTDAQAAAKFFTSSNDGSGSGLICATLDGYTAQQIIDAGTPSGCIAIWSGSVVSIPAGWYLCNGLNGTPDLRDRFVVGAGSHYARNDTGGAATVTTSATVTIASHTLTKSEIPKHTHGTITDNYPSGYVGDWGGAGIGDYLTGFAKSSGNTGSTGGGGGHKHTASFSGTSGQAKLPSYYAACYIQKG